MTEEQNKLADRLEAMLHQVGHPDYSLTEFYKGLKLIVWELRQEREPATEAVLEERFWVVEAVNEDDTVLSPPAYWYGGFIGSTVAGHVGSDIHALCTRFQNAQTAEYVKCLLRNAKILPDRGHHWKIFKHIAALKGKGASQGAAGMVMPEREALAFFVATAFGDGFFDDDQRMKERVRAWLLNSANKIREDITIEEVVESLVAASPDEQKG